LDALWRIELLGGLRAARGEQVVTRFRSQQTAALLAYLAYHPRHAHPREVLIEMLWPECEPEAGRNRLRVALSSLRRQLEPPGVPAGAVLIADRVSVRLNPEACSTDVAAFDAALKAAARAAAASERAERLREALELYQGELLPGHYEAWVFPERQRLSEAFFQALDGLLAYLDRIGDLAGATEWGWRGVRVDPLREEAQRALIRLLARGGQREAALRQYAELERLLQQELGDLPAPETRALVRAIERGDVRPHPGSTEARRGHGERREEAKDPSERPVSERDDRTSPSPELRAPMAHGSPALSGTVTFLLTEGERSTTQRERADGRCEAGLELLLQRLRGLVGEHSGLVLASGAQSSSTWGDVNEVLAAFAHAGDALACALSSQRMYAKPQEPGPADISLPAPSPGDGDPRPASVRIALHTGDVRLAGDDFRSPVLQYARRVLAAGHGGQILCSEETAALLRQQLPPGVVLVDLGVYRLRDLSAPARLFQVEHPDMPRREFPPLRAEAGHAGHLPLQFTRFFGREAEIAELKALLEGSATTAVPRVVTLTGPGGTGKTRLALSVAERLWEGWEGAIWFVSLADVVDARLICDRVRDALRLPRSPHVESLEQVEAFLSQHPSLLILDNFEQLMGAAPGGEDGVSMVRRLLERLPSLTCVITSRQRLGLPGEREFPVAPLPVPGVQGGLSQHLNTRAPEHLNTLTTLPSVALFVDRAQAARPDFQVTPGNAAAVAALCARLEGLPLALELAAARARMLTPQQMLERLERRFELLTSRQRDPDPRHGSLRATLDWSYQLLPPELQRLFARLSVFRGGFTLEAAEAVCSEGVGCWVLGVRAAGPIPNTQHPTPILDGLEHLREGSLVKAEESGGEMRYRLLETLREYAAEQLSAGEQADLARRHGEYYLALVERAEPELIGVDQHSWCARLALEQENLWAALSWVLEGDEPELGLRLGGALWWFWTVRGSYAEGRERLEQLLAAGGTASPAVRAKAQVCAAVLAHFQGDHPAARALYAEAMASGTERGDRWSIAMALIGLAFLHQFEGEAAAARSLFEQSLPVWRELVNRWGIAMALHGLADVAADLGETAEARALFEESLAIRRVVGDQWGIAVSLSGLGMSLLEQGEIAAARELFEESLAIRRGLGDQWGIAVSLRCLGHVARHEGDLAAARALAEQSLAIRRELGDRRGIADSLEGMALVAQGEGRPEAAAHLFGAAAALRERVGAPLPPADRATCERYVSAVRAALGEAAYQLAVEAGRRLSLEQAVAEALRRPSSPRPVTEAPA
jgi:predicted ATPase/DNA-binding SARP family transcriptional activator